MSAGMRQKRIQISEQDHILDRSSLCEFKLQDELFRMKQQIADIVQLKQTEYPQNVGQSLILFKKKRTKKTNTSTLFQSNQLNQNKQGLRKVFQQQKVKSITKNFINKIKRNISHSVPVQFFPYIKDFGDNIFNKKGFSVPHWFDITFAFASILQIFILCFIYTLALVFDHSIDWEVIQTIQTFSVSFYSIEIIINLLSIKTIEGRKVITIKQIILVYLKRKFFIDILCLTVLIVDTNSNFILIKYIRLCVILKIKECLDKLEKIETFFINNFYKEQYWSLAKVFLINFGFAHVLAILLLAMANLSQTSNWIIKLKAQDAPWYQLYSWAYYWGTTIMLTVGFGDLSATNYKEAICLTLIQTFSCILLAYNINCVGNLITNIRSQDLEKTKNFRIMRKLIEKNQIKQQLQEKVWNFIDESDKMKKKFGFEDEKKFITNLPSQLKAEFLKQSNIKIFERINFFKAFSEKTLLALAENIEVKIAHPEQIIFRSEEEPKLLILKQGKLGYCTKLSGSDFSGSLIDILKIKKKESPKLVYLGFLAENARNIKFKIKSLNYSMVYFISIDNMVKIMKGSTCDFQNYCEIKDKSKHVVDEFQILDCQFCSTRHSKMNCPKLHYTPICQMVIYKYLENVKISKNKRGKFVRIRTRSQVAATNIYKLIPYFKKLSDQIYKNRKGGKLKESYRREQSLKHSRAKMKDKQKQFQFLLKHQQENSDKNIADPHLLSEILEILTHKKHEDIELFSWDIDADILHNFKFYFPDQNPSELSIKNMLRQKQAGASNKSLNILNKIMASQFDLFD